MFWLSSRTRNDLFLLYSFADAGAPTEALRTAVAARSAHIPDLRVRLREAPADLSYPSWVPGAFTADQFVEHRLPRPDWAAVETALGELLATGVDATIHPWRLHVFRGVAGAPMRATDDELATVVVLQMSHALADGRRAAAIARGLFAVGTGSGGVGDLDVRSEPGATGGEAMAQAIGAAPGRVGVSDSDAQSEPGVIGGGAMGEAVGAVPGRAGVGDSDARSEPGVIGGGAVRQGTGSGSGRSARGGDSRSGGTWTVRWTGTAQVFGTVVEAVARLRHSGLGAAVSGAVLLPAGVARTAVRGYRAYRAQTELARLTEAGEVPPPGPGFAPSAVNRVGARGITDHRARMIVCAAEELRVPGRTITVVVLTAVSVALSEYLAAQGEPVERLAAQVPMALTDRGKTLSHNNYRSLGVELFIDEPDLRVRADLIAAALADRRLRAEHPLLTAQDRVTAATPAPILRRDVDRYPIDTVPDSIAGHTVVSSVDRGPADLVFGGPVRCTGGFPALGAVMHLTHGVHGLGDTVTVSIHADAAVVPDVDEYADLLRGALRAIPGALVQNEGH